MSPNPPVLRAVVGDPASCSSVDEVSPCVQHMLSWTAVHQHLTMVFHYSLPCQAKRCLQDQQLQHLVELFDWKDERQVKEPGNAKR